MTPAVKRATYQDVLDAPEHMIAEVIDGQLHLQPRPASPHAAVYAGLGVRLVGSFDSDFGEGGPGGWIIRLEPELHLGEDIVVPDLAGWHEERFEAGPRAFFTVAPDWCGEILSPGTRRIDRVEKARIYAREGVGHRWIIDPIEKEIEAFERLASGDWMLLGVFAGEDRVRIKPFDAIELPLAKIWGR